MNKNTRRNISRYPVCIKHMSCFANIDGHCNCLRDTKFKRDCPFFKDKSVFSVDLDFNIHR